MGMPESFRHSFRGCSRHSFRGSRLTSNNALLAFGSSSQLLLVSGGTEVDGEQKENMIVDIYSD